MENPDEVGGPKLKSVLRAPETSALPLVCTPASLMQVWNMSWHLILVVSYTSEYKNKVSETGARICLVSDLYNQIPKLC